MVVGWVEEEVGCGERVSRENDREWGRASGRPAGDCARPLTHTTRSRDSFFLSHTPLRALSTPIQIKDIGSGNFGVAKLMKNKATGEMVAVKFIERGEKVRGRKRKWEGGGRVGGASWTRAARRFPLLSSAPFHARGAACPLHHTIV